MVCEQQVVKSLNKLAVVIQTNDRSDMTRFKDYKSEVFVYENEFTNIPCDDLRFTVDGEKQILDLEDEILRLANELSDMI